MHNFYAHIPGMPRALELGADNLESATQMFRDYLGVKRLPRTAAVWAA